MKNRFSIGQISKLYNIPIKTLRYYDEINLFKPFFVDSNSGYRYYSTEQFEQLHMINYLKFLGIPLKEIRSHLESRDINCFLELLKEEKTRTEDRIEELKKIQNRFENRISELEQATNKIILETVFIKNIQDRKVLRLKEKICSESELELSLSKLENKSNISASIIIGKVGLTVSQKNIYALDFYQYNSIFILLEEELISNELIEVFKTGEYACIYYNGNHSESEEYYKMLLEYIEKNNYLIIGDSIERTIINQFISQDKKDYLTEIQIPIKKY